MTASIPLPRIEALPPGLVAPADFERQALATLDPATSAYFLGGAADQHTLRANSRAWSELQLRPRVLRSLAGGHTRIQLSGRTLDWPVLLAPIAHQRLAHPDGEIATAHAALACATGMVLSTQSSVAVEDIHAILHSEGADNAPPLWFQLYWQHSRSRTLALVRRAEAAGCEALVLTVDAPVQGVRDLERRTGFRVPTEFSAHQTDGLQASPAFPHLHALPAAPADHPSIGLCQGLAAQAPDWDDVQWLLQHTQLPVWLKGITHPEDAQLARELGATGLIVSNHGGRTLDTLPASATLLPAIRSAVDPDYPTLVDGGIRRGTDIFKALALGANAVLIGRPQILGLAAAGAVGVTSVLRLLRDEFEACMTLCGCASVVDIGPRHLFPPAKSFLIDNDSHL